MNPRFKSLGPCMVTALLFKILNLTRMPSASYCRSDRDAHRHGGLHQLPQARPCPSHVLCKIQKRTCALGVSSPSRWHQRQLSLTPQGSKDPEAPDWEQLRPPRPVLKTYEHDNERERSHHIIRLPRNMYSFTVDARLQTM